MRGLIASSLLLLFLQGNSSQFPSAPCQLSIFAESTEGVISVEWVSGSSVDTAASALHFVSCPSAAAAAAFVVVVRTCCFDNLARPCSSGKEHTSAAGLESAARLMT